MDFDLRAEEDRMEDTVGDRRRQQQDRRQHHSLAQRRKKHKEEFIICGIFSIVVIIYHLYQLFVHFPPTLPKTKHHE